MFYGERRKEKDVTSTEGVFWLLNLFTQSSSQKIVQNQRKINSMNYATHSRGYSLPPIELQSTPPMNTRERVTTTFETLKKIFDILVGLPLFILQNVFGINPIGTMLQWACPLCTIITYGALLGVTSSVGIALGVGLGVGLNCAETQYYPTRNLTIANATNATNTTDAFG